MAEVRDARAAHGLVERRAIKAAAVFARLSEGVPLPVAARELTRAGIPVFPCVPGKKGPIVTSGFREASTNPWRVRSWWRWQPRANIAIPTGRVSGLVVVDIDLHGVDGYQAARRATSKGLLPAPLAVVRTPTGGRHLYYPANPALEQRSWVSADEGVDFRGDGGYIVAPPSALLLGGVRSPYVLEHVSSAVSLIAAQALRDFLIPPVEPASFAGQRTGGSESLERLAFWVAQRSEGERNAGLFWAACRLAESGTAPSDALSALGPAAERAGLHEREITRTVGSAYRHVSTYGPRGRAPVRQNGALLTRNQSPVAASASGRGL